MTRLASWLRPTPLRMAAAIGTAAASLAVGTLLMGPDGRSAAMPGPLRSFHAMLSTDCGRCHAASADAVHGPLHGLTHDDVDQDQSGKCLVCHAGLAAAPLLPHGRPATATDTQPADVGATDARSGDGERVAALLGARMSDAVSASDTTHGGIACATCHHEHQGRSEPLAALEDVECQSCHVERFTSFESGHPEFDDYPYRRRQRLAFDHQTHFASHFARGPAAAKPDECTDCHLPDAGGVDMTLRSYDQTCAGCHDDELRGRARPDGPGLVVLGLPALDVLTLRELGLPLGRWPADSSVVETALPPIVASLLAAESRHAADLEILAGADPLDLSDAEPEAQHAAVRVARELKRWLLELSESGQPGARRRLELLLGRSVSGRESADLLGQLPPAVIDDMLRAWLPDLANEVALPDDDERLTSDGSDGQQAGDLQDDPSREAWVSGGGWYRHDEDFTLRYRPRGHADPFLRAWIDVACELQTARPGPASQALATALLDRQGPGQCLRCHVLESAPAGRLSVRWTTRGDIPSLTRFDHGTHFPALGPEGCLGCHRPGGADGGSADDFSAGHVARVTPGFAPMERADCASCHSDAGASQACLTCHDYHLTQGPRLPRAAPLLAYPQAPPAEPGPPPSTERTSITPSQASTGTPAVQASHADR